MKNVKNCECAFKKTLQYFQFSCKMLRSPELDDSSITLWRATRADLDGVGAVAFLFFPLFCGGRFSTSSSLSLSLDESAALRFLPPRRGGGICFTGFPPFLPFCTCFVLTGGLFGGPICVEISPSRSAPSLLVFAGTSSFTAKHSSNLASNSWTTVCGRKK